MFLLDREAFRITRRLVGWILQQNVQSSVRELHALL